MKIFILVFILSFVFPQYSVQTKEYYIHKDDHLKKINILQMINEENADGFFKIEILNIENVKYERKKITLVMPCEIEMMISTDISQSTIDFKVCKDKISSNSSLLIDKANPNIYIKHDKFNFINGTFVVRVSGQFRNSKANSTNIDNDGILREWYDNGQLFLEFNMLNGIKNGICKKWHSNGELMLIYNYNKGRLHGNQKKWYSNGKMRAEWNYINDELHVISSEWYEDGKIKSIKEYKDGELISSNF